MNSASDAVGNNLPTVGSSNINANPVDSDSFNFGMGDYFSNMTWIGVGCDCFNIGYTWCKCVCIFSTRY